MLHKILTGRKGKLNSIRKYKGISGFPKISESEYDVFGTAHSSTSISAAYGISVANRLNSKKIIYCNYWRWSNDSRYGL